MRLRAKIPPIIVIALLAGLINLIACFPTAPAVSGASAARWKAEMESRRGSIVVVNVWARWCRECVEEFPAFVELGMHYRKRGVEFLTLSLDDVGPHQSVAPVESFLRFQATGMPNYILLESLPDSLELLEIEGIPAVLIYRPDGSIAYRLEGDEFDSGIDPGDIEAALQSLLPGPLPGVE